MNHIKPMMVNAKKIWDSMISILDGICPISFVILSNHWMNIVINIQDMVGIYPNPICR